MSKLLVKDRYGITPNNILNSKEISLKAKGLFAYIQSKPDSWRFSVENIETQCKESVESIANGLKELEKYSLLKREKYQDDKGYWHIDYILYSEIKPITEKPASGFPRQENPDTGKTQNISKKELSKKELSKKEKEIQRGEPLSSDSELEKSIAKVIHAMCVIDPKNKLYYNRKDMRGACRFLIEEYSLDRVIRVIGFYKTQKDKQVPYLPSITTPCELRDKWVKLKELYKRQTAEHRKVAEAMFF